MKLLLDTHVLLWWFENDARVGKQVRQLVSEAKAVYGSVVSAWEMAEKARKRKINLTAPFDFLLSKSGFSILPVDLPHIAYYRELVSRHGDPFDRMLVAQAVCEGLSFVTSDRIMTEYPVHVIRP